MNDDTRVDDTAVTDELSTSFLAYAMSVIVSRALPDVRDGMKPVHRRILYSMYDTGLRPDKSFVKSARVVGDAMGRFHPHGDSAIYDAMVRMAQDFSMRVPLIDGHGNFGTHKDPAAAMRYTEARMAHAALAMTDELSEGTVDFADNYDGKLKEPTVLPAAFPQLLVNGSTGIAVGMATNMAPHNLVECVKACQHLLRNPGATVDDLIAIVPAPDLPTGGSIVGVDGAHEAYRTGKGRIRMRATVEFTQATARKRGIVVTELPYMVGPEKVIASIKDAKDDKRLDAVSGVVDLSDRKHGLRLLIELKAGADEQRVLRDLWKYTPLEESFSIHNLALVDGQPRTLSLLELVTHYVNHRLEVTRRRSEYRRAKAQERAHLLEGYVLALANIDEVVRIIRGSSDTAAARTNLTSAFTLTDIQATSILEMPLRRLTSLEVSKIEAELAELRATIAELDALLASDSKLRALVCDELDEVARTLGTPRRTRIDQAPVGDEQDADDETEPAGPATPVLVTVNVTGHMGRFESAPGKLTRHDALVSWCRSQTGSRVHVLTSAGRSLPLPVNDIPDASASKTRGVPSGDLLELAPGERVVAVVDAGANGTVVLVSSSGAVKQTKVADLPKRGGDAFVLKDGEMVAAALWAPVPDSDLLLVSSDGQLLRTPLAGIPTRGAKSGGVAGMRLGAGAAIVGAGVSSDSDIVATCTDGELVKVTPVGEYPSKGRGGAGVRCHRFTKADTRLSSAYVGPAEALVAVTDTTAGRLALETGRRDGAGTKQAGTSGLAGIATTA